MPPIAVREEEEMEEDSQLPGSATSSGIPCLPTQPGTAIRDDGSLAPRAANRPGPLSADFVDSVRDDDPELAEAVAMSLQVSSLTAAPARHDPGHQAYHGLPHRGARCVVEADEHGQAQGA